MRALSQLHCASSTVAARVATRGRDAAKYHVMNSDDAYVKAYLKRIGYICGVNAPASFLGPIEAAKADPRMVVDENANTGFE